MPTELIPQEIRETPAAIRATLAETRPDARRAAVAMHERRARRIFFIGNGTSYHSSLAVTYTARLLGGASDALVLAWPAGDFRYFTPPLGAQDVVVGISASGEFRDILSVFERLKGQCLLLGITHVPGSSITRLADVLLYSGGGPSHVPVMTKTYASTLTAAHLLVLEFFSAPPAYFDDLAHTADLAADAIQQAERLVPAMTAEVARLEHAFYFGAGNAYAAALEAALKMKEMALLHAEGSETWEMASGPATLVGSHTLCVSMNVGKGSAADTATEEGAKHAKDWGARVLEIGPKATVGDLVLPVQPPTYEPFASLALVPPAALLAYHVARARGQTPDTPSWRDRYFSQGMTHIIEG
jgi:glucosamine--fructose-6-phosphate aminotransferase (isomerizing)